MPWKIDDVDKHNKDLTQKQKKVWVKVANRALAVCEKKGGTDCEASAIRQANAIVKKMNEELLDLFYDDLDLIPEDENILEHEVYIKEGEDMGVGRLFEEVVLSFEKDNALETVTDASEKRELLVTFITSGWSKNGNYWSPEIVKNLSERLLEEAHTQYVDHILTRTTRSRSLYDKASTSLESWFEEKDGKTVGKARVQVVPASHKNGWLYDMAKEMPQEVRASVDTWVKVKKGKAEGREGTIIEHVAIFFSFDYVDRDSAGGGVDKALESEFFKRESVIDFKDFIIKWNGIRKYQDLHWWLESYIAYILKKDEIKNKKKVIDETIDKYAVLLKALPFDKMHDNSISLWNIGEKLEFSDKSWSSVDKSNLNASAFLIVENKFKRDTWHLPYRDDTGKVNREVLQSLAIIVETEKYKNDKFTFSISEKIKAKVRLLEILSGIEYTEDKDKPEVLKEYFKNWLYDLPGLNLRS